MDQIDCSNLLPILPSQEEKILNVKREATQTIPAQDSTINLKMSPAEKFCLRWNDFENKFSSAFQELRENEDFFDVTLACGDQQIEAHKVV